MTKLKYITPALIAIACFGLQQVKANVFQFDLTGVNAGLGGYLSAGPFVHVTVTTPNGGPSTTATISFTSLTNNGNIYLMGDGGSVAVNVSSSFTLGMITGANAGTGFSPGPYSNGGPGNMDGFGSFNLTINSMGGYTGSADHITFTLTNTSGTWTNASKVLELNQLNGALAAAHIFVATFPADASAGALATGFAAGSGIVNINPLGSVPDGGTTVMLLGAALGALGLARRYLKS